jgi:tRNA dimethylallyltransferase
LDEAAVIGRADTRHYAKRQFTWFRHQLPEFEWVKPDAVRAWLSSRFSLSPNAGNPAKL